MHRLEAVAAPEVKLLRLAPQYISRNTSVYIDKNEVEPRLGTNMEVYSCVVLQRLVDDRGDLMLRQCDQFRPNGSLQSSARGTERQRRLQPEISALPAPRRGSREPSSSIRC
jgi:hypothetical protein